MPLAPVSRIARYQSPQGVAWGRLDGEDLIRLDGPPWAGGRERGGHDRLAEVRLLAPTVPTKIVCVGLNYRAHIAESQSVAPGAEPPKEPLIFLKPPSAAIGHDQPILYPAGVTRLDPEAELAVVIARRARRVSEAEAPACIAGLTCFNDVSARNYQRGDGQWTRAKGFDTFAPMGPWIAAGLDPSNLAVECRVNGERRQQARTSDLLFPVPHLVSFISRVMTLEPGDVIATGTPAGIAPIQPGDVVEVEVEGVGVLRNRVEASEA